MRHDLDLSLILTQVFLHYLIEYITIAKETTVNCCKVSSLFLSIVPPIVNSLFLLFWHLVTYNKTAIISACNNILSTQMGDGCNYYCHHKYYIWDNNNNQSNNTQLGSSGETCNRSNNDILLSSIITASDICIYDRPICTSTTDTQ